MEAGEETRVLALEGGGLAWRRRLPADEAIAYANEGDALAWLRRPHDASASLVMRRALASVGVDGLSLRDDDHVVRAVARALSRGSLRGVIPRAAFARSAAPLEDVAPRPTPVELTSIEIHVVWDHEGGPIPNVALEVELPSGESRSVRTDGAGIARISGIRRGSCVVSSDLAGARRGDTLHVVGIADDPIGDAGAPPQRKHAGAYRLARVTRHRVRGGESLDLLAKQNATTWKALAEFNWGTSVPREINERLRAEVGCTKKTEGGKNYLFDDGDHPGIVLIPSAYRQPFSTGEVHTIRVLQHRFAYVLYDQHHRFPLPHHEYLLYDGDKHVLTGESDEEGRVMLDEVPARWHIDVIGPGPSHAFWDTSSVARAPEPTPPEEHAFDEDDLYDDLTDHA